MLVVGSVLAGCGGGASASSEIASTFRSYLHDYLTNQGAKLCDVLTPAMARNFGRSPGQGVPSTSCVQAVANSQHHDPIVRQQLAKRLIINVTGNTATVRSKGEQGVLQFTKLGGRWRISGPLTRH